MGQESSHYVGQDLEALAELPHYTGWILEQFQDHLHGRVIEVGAGIGNVAVRYIDQVDHALLVEPAANLHERLQARVRDRAHVRVVQAFLEDVPQELLRIPFDAAVMVNVLEHIEDDQRVLQKLHEVLRPGGAVCIFVPALPQLFGTLDEIVDHVRRYRKAELGQKLENSGFRIERLEYLDLLGIVPWWLAGQVLKRRQYDALGAQAYDRVGVPVTRALEHTLHRLLGRTPVGKSLVAVGVRV